MLQSPSTSRPPIVLIVGDQDWTVDALEQLFADAGYAVVRTVSGEMSLQFVHDLRPDAVIVACTGGSMAITLDAIELSHRVRFATNAATPVVITSTRVASAAERSVAYDAGAWDVVHRPIDGEMFMAKIATYVRAKRELDRVQSASFYDDVPEVYSLRGVTQCFREVSALASRMRRPVACIAVSGDVVGPVIPQIDSEELTRSTTTHVALVCRHASRRADIVGRISKTEVAIIAPKTTRAGAEQYVRRLVAAFQIAPLIVGETTHTIRLRTGISAMPETTTMFNAVEPLYRAVIAMRRKTPSSDFGSISGDESPLPLS